MTVPWLGHHAPSVAGKMTVNNSFLTLFSLFTGLEGTYHHDCFNIDSAAQIYSLFKVIS